jgi:hypothetical protein
MLYTAYELKKFGASGAFPCSKKKNMSSLEPFIFKIKKHFKVSNKYEKIYSYR